MSRRDRTPLPPEIDRELAALDAALAGEPVDPDLSDLAALAVAVRDARPRPDAGVVARLDERAGAGFAAPRRRPRGRLAASLVAASLALAVIAGVAVLSSGGDRGGMVATAPGPATRQTTPAGDIVTESRGVPDESAALAPAAPKAVAPGASAPSGAVPNSPARSVERAAALRLSVLPGGLDDVASGVLRTTDALGGYVVSSSVESRGARGSASFDLRVPAARLQSALARLSQLARVRSRSQSSLDVTGSVVAVRTRLDALRAERRGVLRQLAAATTPAETARARARIRVLDVRIARAQAERAALRRRTAFSTIDVEVTTRRPAAGATTGARGPWTPRDALHDAVRVLSVAVGAALVAVAALLPLGLILAAGYGVWRVTVARRRRHALDPAT